MEKMKPIGIMYWVICPKCKCTVSASTISALEENVARHIYGHVQFDCLPITMAKKYVAKMEAQVYKLAKEVDKVESFTGTSILWLNAYLRCR